MPSVALEQGLAEYLDAPLVYCRTLASGWETTISEFEVRTTRLPIPTAQPLVLRLYRGPDAEQTGQREYAIIKQLSTARFPVPTPFLLERDCDALGAPFMIMSRLEGGPLLQPQSLAHAVKTFTLAFPAFVRTHARLHRLNPAALGIDQLASAPRDGAPGLIARQLARIAELVTLGPLPWLTPALDVLRSRAPTYTPGATALLHMDYHPLNALVRGARVTGIIDWTHACLGERHLDVATTAMILSTWAPDKPAWLGANPTGNSLRGLFATLYLATYQALAPMNFKRLRFCQALAAMTRLATVATMRLRGPETVGYRAEAAVQITPSVISVLARYAGRKCGVAIVPG